MCGVQMEGITFLVDRNCENNNANRYLSQNQYRQCRHYLCREPCHAIICPLRHQNLPPNMPKRPQLQHSPCPQSKNRGYSQEGDDKPAVPDQIDPANLQKHQHLEPTSQNPVISNHLTFKYIHPHV